MYSSFYTSKKAESKSTQEKVDFRFLGEKNTLQLANLRHSTVDWLTFFKESSRTRNSSRLHNCRILIQNQTLLILNENAKNGTYETEGGIQVQLDLKKLKECVKMTRMYPANFSFQTEAPLKFEKPVTVEVFLGDCVEAAIHAQRHFQLSKVALLNMANANHPGGGFRHGAGAQEENLHRRSDLFWHLSDPFHLNGINYPIPPHDGAIYSDEVHFFRGAETQGYPFLAHPFTFAVISMAAQKGPETFYDSNKGRYDYTSEARQIAEAKILAMLEVARDNHVEALVLSAFGCGAFKNPPASVAEIFKETIEKFAYNFKVIIFSIIDDHNTGKAHNPDGNFLPFFNIFKKQFQPQETIDPETTCPYTPNDKNTSNNNNNNQNNNTNDHQNNNNNNEKNSNNNNDQ